MSKHVYVSLFGPMPDRPTGLAMSVLRRAKAFASAGTKTTILVDRFVPDIHRHLLGLQQNDELSAGMIAIRSMHLELAGDHSPLSQDEYVSPTNYFNAAWEYTQDHKRPEVWRGRNKGDYQEFVWMRDDHKVSFIDYLTNDGKVRLRRTWFNVFGDRSKIEYMNQNNKPFLIEYLNRDGRVYLTHFPDRQPRYTINTDRGTGEFFDLEALYEYWLRNYVFPESAGASIISEYGDHIRTFESLTLNLDLKVIYTFHSSHYAYPYGYGSAVRSEQETFVSQIRRLPAMVVLTEEQKLDLLKQFGPSNNVHVIPHHVPIEERTVERDPNRIVMVSRFDKLKGHRDALRAFSMIRRINPSARLEIYGRGPDEAMIDNMVNDLGLTDSAKLMGFTDDAASIFAGAAISLIPSAYEGFCLSLIESMSQGCVPLAYRFKYGPADIITNGRDGFIVENGNIEDLADTASLILRDKPRRRKMSAEARKIADVFTEERLVTEWRTTLRSIGSDAL